MTRKINSQWFTDPVNNGWKHNVLTTRMDRDIRGALLIVPYTKENVCILKKLVDVADVVSDTRRAILEKLLENLITQN